MVDSNRQRCRRARPAVVAVFAIAVLATGCAAGGVTTTDAQGSTTSRVRKPPGTILVVDPNGETAAAALGKTVAVIPPPTTEAPTTTTTAPPTTLPVTTQAPVTTPRPTVATTPPVTSGGGGPVTSLGSLKPALVPMSTASLSGDEQAIVNGINARRGASGLGGVTPEQHATELARQHTASMIASGQPSNIVDVFNKVNAQYKTITQLTFNWSINEDATQYILTQYGSQVSGPFTSIGIGVSVNAGQRWVTVLLGA